MMDGVEYEWKPRVYINEGKSYANIDEYGQNEVSNKYVKITDTDLDLPTAQCTNTVPPLLCTYSKNKTKFTNKI